MKGRPYGEERGASLVEFALVAPIFFLLLLGTVTGGLAFSHKLDLSTASREAARYAATLPVNYFSGSAADGADWASQIASEATNAASGALGASGSTVCVALVQGSGTSTTVYNNPPSSGTSAYYYNDTYNGTSWVANSGSVARCFDDGGADTKMRVQVMVTRPDSIQAVFFSYHVTLQAQAVAYFESGS